MSHVNSVSDRMTRYPTPRALQYLALVISSCTLLLSQYILHFCLFLSHYILHFYRFLPAKRKRRNGAYLIVSYSRPSSFDRSQRFPLYSGQFLVYRMLFGTLIFVEIALCIELDFKCTVRETLPHS